MGRRTAKLEIKIEHGFDRLLKEYNEDIDKALHIVGEMAQRNIRAFAPIDTGALRASISVISAHQSDFESNKQAAQALRSEANIATSPRAEHEAVWIAAPMHYAAYVEFGTRFMNSQPYFVRGIMEALDELVLQVKKVFSGPYNMDYKETIVVG